MEALQEITPDGRKIHTLFSEKENLKNFLASRKEAGNDIPVNPNGS